MVELPENTVMLVSYFGFEMHSLDFGKAFGSNIEAIKLPSKVLIPGIPVILPDGSTYIMKYKEDDLFYRFPKRIYWVF
jgi:hypothetical protein